MKSIYIEIYVFLAILAAVRASKCKLYWNGVWQENNQEFNITYNSFGTLGTCIHKSRDLYLLSSETSRGTCYRCIITFPVHENVLHYKKTQCIFDQNVSLERCTSIMSAETSMHTLFRKDSASVPCPIEAPLNFTYQSSYGLCSSRTSHIHRCAQHDRLALYYQACPEIPNKEAAVWQMECVASWKSYGQHYFAARVASRSGEQYRCFILDRSGTGGRIGESADASCQELTHIGAASTTLHFKQDWPITSTCDFGTKLQDGRSYWESMVEGTEHRINQGTWIATSKGQNESVWTCLESVQVDKKTTVYRTHVAHGCKTGFQCLKVIHRRNNAIQVSYGPVQPSDEFSECSDFSPESRDVLTVYGSQTPCKLQGKNLAPICARIPVVTSGCNTKYSMQIVNDCSLPDGDDFTCIADYEDDGIDFLVLKDTLSRQLICLTHIDAGIKLVRVYDRVSCDIYSVNGVPPMITLNISSTESCSPSLLTGYLFSSSKAEPKNLTFLFQIFVIIFAML